MSDEPLTTNEKVEAAAFTMILALLMIGVIAGSSAWLYAVLRWMGW